MENNGTTTAADGERGDRLGRILARAVRARAALTPAELTSLLSLSQARDLARLFDAARDVKRRCCGRGVAVRALVEAGNGCGEGCGRKRVG
jgi:biotin synthase-like enzyme